MHAASPARQARGEERIERILRGTLAVIARDGTAAVTHRAVADEAGVPLGSLTYYFDSKQELLRAALRLHVAEDVGRLEVLAAGLASSGASPQEVVEGFAASLRSSDPDHIAQFELYLEAARDPGLRAVATESLAAYRGVAEQALRAAGVREPEAAAGLVVGAVDGLGLQRAAAGDGAPDLRATLQTLLHLLTR